MINTNRFRTLIKAEKSHWRTFDKEYFTPKMLSRRRYFIESSDMYNGTSLVYLHLRSRPSTWEQFPTQLGQHVLNWCIRTFKTFIHSTAQLVEISRALPWVNIVISLSLWMKVSEAGFLVAHFFKFCDTLIDVFWHLSICNVGLYSFLFWTVTNNNEEFFRWS